MRELVCQFEAWKRGAAGGPQGRPAAPQQTLVRSPRLARVGVSTVISVIQSIARLIDSMCTRSAKSCSEVPHLETWRCQRPARPSDSAAVNSCGISKFVGSFVSSHA